MSALDDTDDPLFTILHLPERSKLGGAKYGELVVEKAGELGFICREQSETKCGFVFDGVVPEVLIDRYLNEDPDCLVEGFKASAKATHCEWMSESRIKSIVNHMGSVLVELEPAGAA